MLSIDHGEKVLPHMSIQEKASYYITTLEKNTPNIDRAKEEKTPNYQSDMKNKCM